jgi:hypothetical protein
MFITEIMLKNKFTEDKMKADMQTEISKKKLWTGRIMSTIAVLFLLFDSITKIFMSPQVVEATSKLGYPVSLIPVIGLILLVLTILYVIPFTSIFGTILLTGYLGGAVASNLRVMNPLYSNTLFPVYFAIILWGGLFFRNELIRKFFPFVTKSSSPARNSNSNQTDNTNFPLEQGKINYSKI